MGITEILKKLFRRRARVVVLKKAEHLRYQKNLDSESPDDKTIFEIRHAVNMQERQQIISGKIKRGIFRTGDRIAIYDHMGTVFKTEAVISNIKTALVDVNRIASGFEADFLIETAGGCPEINAGDRVYKIQEELKNVIQ